MNVKDIVKFLKGYKRMCEQSPCIECPIYKIVETKNLDNCDADMLIFDAPEQFANAVIEWVETHPVITNATKFKEVFGINPEDAEHIVIGSKNETCWWNEEYIPPRP